MNGWLFNLRLKRFEAREEMGQLGEGGNDGWTCGCISPAKGSFLSVNLKRFKHDHLCYRAAAEPRLVSRYERTEVGNEILMR